MKIACLQYAPEVGKVESNLAKLQRILERGDTEGLDVLVLPELALTGYNFKSLEEIAPFTEPQTTGRTSEWARQTAVNLNCSVIAGYPERVDGAGTAADAKLYNSAIVVDADGQVLSNYRKTHLYYTDDTWAEEGSGFLKETIPRLGTTALGICMDLNSYKFGVEWDKYEFARHAVDADADVIILSMAWNTFCDRAEFFQESGEPDMDSLSYWLARLQPVLHNKRGKEVIVIFANRSGVEDTTTYVGTSAVLGIKDGDIFLYGMLGRDDERLLVVDTRLPPQASLRMARKDSDTHV